MKIILCSIGFIVAASVSYGAHSEAASAIHEIYGALWAIVATIFLCSGLIIETINHKSTNQSIEKSNK